MAFPSYVNTRQLNIGAAVLLETGDDARVSLTITASKSLIRQSNGFRFESRARAINGEVGQAAVFSLPVTDQAGWIDQATKALIDVSAPNSYTHLYTGVLSIFDASGVLIRTGITIGPFPVPSGSGEIDLDLLVPATAVPGGQITIPVGGGSGSVSDASATVKGIVQLATTAEAAAGTNGTKAVTPAGVAAALAGYSPTVPAASLTASGVVELATLAETLAGTDAVRAVTPAGLKGVADTKLNSTDAPELIRDTIGAALVAGTGVVIAVNDAGDTITLSVSSTGNGRNVYYTGTAWPARPSGGDPVTYISTKVAAAAAPTDRVVGDMWIRHPDAFL